jgi:basic amino acid/polyamine antiporter, APA family
VTETLPPEPGRQELVRVIGRWSLAALIINCIIGSGVFGLPSVVAALVGRASVLAVLFGGVGAAVIMACFAEVASRFTETGGPYLYVRSAFGRLLGIEVGWLVWLVRLASCAANANLFVIYLGEFWSQATQPAPRLAILTLLLGILAAINIRGVRAGTQVSNFFAISKLSALAIVCGAGAFYLMRTHHFVAAAGVNPTAGAWVRAMMLLIFAYGGFEAAVISSGEAKNPRRDMAFGLLIAVIAVTAIYGLIQWVVVAVLPDPGHSERPLADVARIVIGPGGAAVIAGGALLAVYGYLSGNILATPRITFALAERGDFPRFFAAVHRRFHTPYFSIAIFAVLVWMLALFGSFTANATLSAGARLFYYGLVCAGLPVLRKKQPGAALFRLPAGSLFAVVGVLICLGLLTQIDFGKSLVLGVTFAIGLVNWMAVRKPLGT